MSECQYTWVKELLKQNVVIRISTEIHEKTLFRFNPKNSENEYRVSEKAFLSKGIGKEYLTEDVINYYLQNPYAMYDFYDVKKRMVKSRPLPKYYSEMIYNPILKIDGKNQYDENKRPIRLHNIKCFEEYSKTPLFKKQLKNYESEQIRFNRLLELYNNDIQLLTEQEYIKRKVDEAIQINRRKNIEELQKHSNYINNLQEI